MPIFVQSIGRHIRFMYQQLQMFFLIEICFIFISSLSNEKTSNVTIAKPLISKLKHINQSYGLIGDDDGELFCGMVDRRKVFILRFQSGPLLEILTIANLEHAVNRT